MKVFEIDAIGQRVRSLAGTHTIILSTHILQEVEALCPRALVIARGRLVAQGTLQGATCWQPTWAVPSTGSFYPPTLFTDVAPSSMIAQVEIFGPVLVAMTFRTPDEAVALANNTPFGLAASIWSDNINLALDIAPPIVVVGTDPVGVVRGEYVFQLFKW